MQAKHHPRREAVEKRLGLQAAILSSTKHLIEGRIPLDQWPMDELASFYQALHPTRGNEFEFRKARNLARHLFRGHDTPSFPEGVSDLQADLAERLRADLPGLLRLGAGIYMTALTHGDELKADEPAATPRPL